jgi:competence protein ComEC
MPLLFHLSRIHFAVALFLLVSAACAGAESKSLARSGSAPAASGRLVVTFFDMSGGLATPARFRHLGLAVLLQTPSGGVYLYDTGASVPIDKRSGPVVFDTGRDCIAPLLTAKGISRIDGIVVSHGHADHHGGAEFLLDHFPVKQILHPVLTLPDALLIEGAKRNKSTVDELVMIEALIKSARAKGVRDRVLTAGDKLDWDPALAVDVLSPPKNFLPSKVSIENANSLVLRVQHGKNVFLFTGDALEETQRHLMATFPPETLKTTVMSAPHHGYSCYAPFSTVVRPDIVVVSCGANNALDRGGKTKAAFEPVGTKVYVTPWHGTVEIISNGNGYIVKTEREPSEANLTPKK